MIDWLSYIATTFPHQPCNWAGLQAVLFPADVRTLSAGNVNELTGILRGNPRVMSMHEEFKRL